MQFNKKVISADLLQLTLLVILLRLGPERYPDNRWNEDVEVREIYLGASSAYAQFNFHNHHIDSHALVYHKSIDSMIIEDTLSVLGGLNYRRQDSVLAFYVSSGDNQEECRSVQEEPNNVLASAPPNLVSTGQEGNGDGSSHLEEQDVLTQNYQGNMEDPTRNEELTDEDMNLIEVLLKEDIEPGAPLDGIFDSLEFDKVTTTANQKELRLHDDISALNEFTQLTSSFYNQWENLSPSSGSEAVDHANHEQSSEGEAELPVFCEDDDDAFANSLLEDTGWNLHGSSPSSSSVVDVRSDAAFSSCFPDFDENISVDEESMFAHLDKLEGLNRTDENANTDSEGMVSELYPNMEDCWPDITTTVPLPVVGSTHHGASLSLLTRPSLTYTGMSSPNYPLSSNQTNVNENLSGVLLQNATLTPPVPDVAFPYIPTALGPSSIGCAVAASMATLTNDTDPVPDSGTVSSYTQEFPEFIYPNHTAVTSQGEYILSDFLIDEDLQLMDMQASATYATPVNAVVGEHMDTSSDSAVSLTSGRVPSISDCQEWVDCCSDSSHQGDHDGSFIQMETSFPLNQNSGIERESNHYSSDLHQAVAQKKYKLFGRKTSSNNEEVESGSGGCKHLAHGVQSSRDFLYIPIKQAVDELASCPYGSVDGAAASPHDGNFAMASSISSSGGYVPYPQHNHTYHVPFVSSNSLEKPITRDKTRTSRLDYEPSSRDERRAKALKLPISIADIINLAIDEFNEKLSKYDLTEAQHTLIRDIRRRGKNKVAAQNCRKRKMDQINTLQHDLDHLQAERLQLETEQNQMLHQRRYYEDKYAKLYQYVLQASNSQTTNSVLPSCDTPVLPVSANIESNNGTDSNRGARTKKKIEKKSP